MPPKVTETKGKHLTLEERTELQDCLYHGVSFKAIGRRLGKDPTTISKEVKRNITVTAATAENAELCPRLLRAPFVCNGCQRRKWCRLEKHMYYARQAQQEYERKLVESRSGVSMNREEFWENDRILTERVRSGQHIYHAIQCGGITCSKSTVYRHIKQGHLSIGPLDTPRMVKFKPRKSKVNQPLPKGIRAGRSFADFQQYCAEHDVSSWVELDLVIGQPGGKVIMTFDFTFCNLMFGILLDNKRAATVALAFEKLKADLASAGFCFGDVFPLLLTDNGGEFAHVNAIELDAHGFKEASLFFCDPASPAQKPRVEKNHTLLRDILPQGSSFDTLSQQDIDLVFSHINAVLRKSLNGKSPYSIFEFTFGSALLDALGLSSISPECVIQSPRLLKSR